MLVISGNITDTIFPDLDNQWIVFPEQQRAYHDDKGIFKASLTGRIKEFFDYNFDKQLRVKNLLGNLDSVPLTAIRYGRHPLIRNKVLDIPFSSMNLREETDKYGSRVEYYVTGVDTIHFSNRNTSIAINDKATSYDINGIKPGYSEQTLKKLYLISTVTPLFYHTRFEDMLRMYYYLVRIEGNKGHVLFIIKDGVVNSILIDLDEKYILKP